MDCGFNIPGLLLLLRSNPGHTQPAKFDLSALKQCLSAGAAEEQGALF
jgi:hypothetical protein